MADRFAVRTAAVLARAQRGQPVQHFDVQMTHRNGQKLLVNVSTLPIPDEAREATEAMVHLLRPRAGQASRKWRLRVAVLGPLRAWQADGSPVNGPHWRRIKVRALFACLVLAGGHPVPRERILDCMWPEMPYDAALRNLNTTVYHLRRSLEPDLDRPSASRFVLYEAGYYQLSGSFWLDATEFEHTIGRARREIDPVEAIRLYRIATELYRGGFIKRPGQHVRLERRRAYSPAGALPGGAGGAGYALRSSARTGPGRVHLPPGASNRSLPRNRLSETHENAPAAGRPGGRGDALQPALQ